MITMSTIVPIPMYMAWFLLTPANGAGLSRSLIWRRAKRPARGVRSCIRQPEAGIWLPAKAEPKRRYRGRGFS
jgi:hypothetical protein